MGTFQQDAVTRTYQRRSIRINGGDGSFAVEITVMNANGRQIDRLEVRVPASGAILDEEGTQIAAVVPVGLASARASFLSAVDAAVDNAAAAGKFAR
jgi:hypothetical protein